MRTSLMFIKIRDFKNVILCLICESIKLKFYTKFDVIGISESLYENFYINC